MPCFKNFSLCSFPHGGRTSFNMGLLVASWFSMGLSLATKHPYAILLSVVSTTILTLSSSAELVRSAIVTSGVLSFVLTMLHLMTAFLLVSYFNDCDENLDEYLKHVDDDAELMHLEETFCDDIQRTVILSFLAGFLWLPVGIFVLRLPEAGDYKGGETTTTFPTPNTELA